MRRLLILLLSVALMISLFAACTPKETTDSGSETTTDDGTAANDTAASGDDGADDGADDGETVIVNDTLVITGSNALTDVIGSVWKDSIGLYLDQIFEKLVVLDLNGEATVPQLAKEWTLSEDKMTYTFTLQDGIKWHDGEPFTVDDIVWSIETFMKAATVNTYVKTAFENIEGMADYVDGSADTISGVSTSGNTISITLTTPSTAFLPKLTMFNPLPKHLLKDEDPATIDKCSYWSNPIGTGPYKVAEWNPNNYLMLTRFDDYYGAKPNIPNIKVLVTKSPEDQLKGMLAGEIPYGYFSDVTQAAQVLASDDKFVAQEISSGYIRTLRANLNGKGGTTNGNPVVEDANVRIALMLAINKEELCATVMEGMAIPQDSVISISDPSYNAAAFEDFSYDPARAKQMLEAADFDFDTTLTLASCYSNQNSIDVVNAIAGYWAAIGVNTEVSIPATGTSIIDFIYNARDFDFIYQANSYPASSAATAYDFFIPDGSYSELLNAKFGAPFVPLQQEFYAEFDSAKRMQLVKDLQEVEADLMLCLPLFELKAYAIYDSTLLSIPDGTLTYDNDGFYRGLDKWKFIK